jgi:hypothetical protein
LHPQQTQEDAAATAMLPPISLNQLTCVQSALVQSAVRSLQLP